MIITAKTAPEDWFKFMRWQYAMVCLAMQTMLIGYILIQNFYTAARRREYFNREFMKQFDKDHTKAFPKTKEAP